MLVNLYSFIMQMISTDIFRWQSARSQVNLLHCSLGLGSGQEFKGESKDRIKVRARVGLALGQVDSKPYFLLELKFTFVCCDLKMTRCCTGSKCVDICTRGVSVDQWKCCMMYFLSWLSSGHVGLPSFFSFLNFFVEPVVFLFRE